MYRVIRAFADKADNMRVNGVGDKYPRPGYAPDAARIAELSAMGIIEAVPEPAPGAEPAKPAPKKRVKKDA